MEFVFSNCLSATTDDDNDNDDDDNDDDNDDGDEVMIYFCRKHMLRFSHPLSWGYFSGSLEIADPPHAEGLTKLATARRKSCGGRHAVVGE